MNVPVSVSLPEEVWAWIDQRVKEGNAKSRSAWIRAVVLMQWKRVGESAVEERQLELRSKFCAARFLGAAIVAYQRGFERLVRLPVGASDVERAAAMEPPPEVIEMLQDVMAVEEQRQGLVMAAKPGRMPTLEEWKASEAAAEKGAKERAAGRRKLKAGRKSRRAESGS